MNACRRFYACGVVTSTDENGEEDVEVVVAGGRNATGALATADIYSFRRNSWRSGETLSPVDLEKWNSLGNLSFKSSPSPSLMIIVIDKQCHGAPV